LFSFVVCKGFKFNVHKRVLDFANIFQLARDSLCFAAEMQHPNKWTL